MIIYMFSEKHALINNSFAIIELFRVLTVIAKVLKNFLYLYNRFQNCSNTSFNVSNTHQLHWPTKYTSVALANKIHISCTGQQNTHQLHWPTKYTSVALAKKIHISCTGQQNTHQLHWPTKYTSVALANKSG